MDEEKMVTISVQFPELFLARIKADAKKVSLSTSAFIRLCAYDYYDRKLNAATSPFDKSFDREYELARKTGDARFGSECAHEHVVDGRCVDCQRKVR